MTHRRRGRSLVARRLAGATAMGGALLLTTLVAGASLGGASVTNSTPGLQVRAVDARGDDGFFVIARTEPGSVGDVVPPVASA